MKSRYAAIFMVALLGLLLLPRAGQCQLMTGGWPKFRGDARNTGLSQYVGPSVVAQDWTYLTGATVSCSPAIGPDGKVYFASQDQKLYALNSNGSLIWQVNIGSLSSSSPAIASDGTIYIGSDNYFLYAINPNGTVKWQKGLGKQIKSSPAIGPDGTVYVGCTNGKLFAYTPAGVQKWSLLTGNPIVSAPAISSDGGTIYVGSEDQYLYAVDTAGAVRWRYYTSGLLDTAPAVASDGTIYVGTSDGRFYAINSTGTLKWSYRIGVAIKSSAAIGSDGTIYFGCDDNNVYALNPNGTLKWSYATGGRVQSSPAIGSDGTIYVGSMDSKVYALNADGTLMWSAVIGGQTTSSPAIGPDGALYIGCNDKNLYAFARDRTPPTTPVVTDDGVYTTDATTLHASWVTGDPDTGIMDTRYAIGTTSGGNDVVDWTSVGTDTSVTRTGLSLVNGVTYYISVKSQNGAHNWSAVGVSDGIKLDQTPPQTPVVTDDGAFTSSPDTIHAVWSAIDAESGVVGYQYCIGRTAGAGDVVGWTSAGTNTSITQTGLILTQGYSYYVTVKALNGAGLWSANGTNDGITVDRTAPPGPVVTDDGAFTASNTSLHASWTGTDPDSGVSEYQYAIGTTVGGTEVLGWTTTGTTPSVTRTGLALSDGVTYYISVKIKNGSGLWGPVGTSDGIIVDASAPTVPIVTDDGQFTSSSSTLHATWTSNDPHTGIAEYQYAIGTTIGGTDILGWTSTGTTANVTKTGLALTSGSTYYISVKARNQAGVWSAYGVSDGITVDLTPPQTPAVTDDGQYTSNNTALHATWAATDAESGVAEYQYAIGTTSGGSEVIGWTSTGSTASVTKTGLSLSDGITYYVSVKARNNVNMWSNVGTSDGIIVDASGPSVPVVTDDGAYTSSSNTLHATWTATDLQSGVAEYQYAIGTTPGGTDTVGWTSTGTTASVTRTGLTLAQNTTYYISVRAKSGSGVWGPVGSSDGILLDLTAPPAPVVTDDGQYTTDNTSLHVTWTANDPESGIADYQYAIGTTSGGTDISGWALTGNVNQITRTGLSLTDGVTYYIAVKARNKAGAWGPMGVSDGIIVDHTPPTMPTVTDDGDYTTSATQLHATWVAADANSGLAEYQYAIGTTQGGTDIVGWTSTGTLTYATRTGLSLTDGVTYYISVKARNNAGLWSSYGASDGIIVDTTPPTAPVVTDDGDFTASSTTLHASWVSSDPHSGVVQYQYAIGTTPGGTNVVTWTSAAAATEITRTGLTLSHNTTYYFSVKAKNAAGLWSAVGNSNGILVDLTAPPYPVVTDDGDYTSSTTSLHATWTAADPESGVIEYQYAIGTTANGTTISPWTSVGNANEITRTGLTLTNGVKYYISVKARNGAGTWSAYGASDGITVDSTPPSQPTVTDDGVYTTNNAQLHATWSAADTESTVAEYQYAIGTSSGASDIVGWTSTGTTASVTKTGLSLTDGVNYYFSVKARNGAGLWSSIGSSDGIEVDATPPTVPVVTDDGFTASSTTLHAIWSSDDPHTGVVQYQYAIGTTPGGTNTVAWTSAGTATEITRASLVLAHNTTYYFSVKAKNAAGLWSAVGTSSGVLVDLTAPTTPVVVDDGDYTSSATTLHASWTAADVESGVAEYQYAIGTTKGGAELVGWTSAGTALEITRSDLNLTNGTKYYFAVKAKNRPGTWSTVGTADGITVDLTPPTTPVVTDDGQFTANNTSLHASWTGADPESGILDYQYAIGTSPGDASVVGWTSIGTATTVTKNGLTLTDGVTYYISVKARNKALMLGAIGSSDGIMVDASAPTTPVVTDDGYTDSTNSLHAAWTATDPHSGVQDYQYAIGTTPGGTNTVNWTSCGAVNEITATGLTLVQNTTYYFSVKARNRSGLWSTIGTSAGELVDFTPPPAPIVTDDGHYTTTGTSLHVTWTGGDPESGIAEFQYAVGTTAGSTNVLGWTSAGSATSATITGLSLIDGTTYYVSVRAKNKVGRFGAVGSTDGIIVDATPPTTPIVTDDGAVAPTLDTLHATWTSSDPHTGVVEYQYAIGTAPGGSDMVGWTSVGTATGITKTGLSLVGGVTYYFSVKAKNAAGGWSQVGSSDGIMVDKTPPTTPVITPDARYTSVTTQLHATWTSTDPESGVVEYQYAIGTTPGGSDISAWVSVGTTTDVTKTGLTLIEGTTYYWSVKARNKVLLWSDIGISTGVTVDTSGPTISAVNDDGEYTLSLDTLHATWTAMDPQSGIVEYQYCIGTTSGAADIAGWTSAGGLSDITRGGLQLIDGGTYFFAVRAKNGAGLWGSIGVSDGITVAISAAWPKFRMDSQNHGVSRFFGSRLGALLWQFPTYSWMESSPALSGDGTAYVGSNDGNVYAISRQGNLVWSFETGGPIDSSPAIAKDGSIYIGSYDGYVYCLSAGKRKWAYKTGGIIRSSPAIGPDEAIYFTSYDDCAYALNSNGTLKWKCVIGTSAEDYLWSSPAISSDGSTLYFGASDGYIYALNTADGTRKWRSLTGTAVDSSPSIGADGTVYAGSGDGFFYALDPATGAQKWTLYNGGWAFDSSAAIGADGTIYVGCGQDFSYGVLYVLNPNGTLKWSPIYFDGGVRSSPAISSEGTVYVGAYDQYFYAFNPDGTLRWRYFAGSPIISSAAIGRDGRVVIGASGGNLLTFKDSNIDDTTPPTRPTVVDEGATTSTTTALTAAWTSNDPESGISDYVYAIGTWPGTADIVPWTDMGLATTVTKTGLSLSPGVTYYFSVKSMNAGRMWSPVGVSDGIQVTSGQQSVSVGRAKLLPDLAAVTLQDKIVTARFDGSFYVEEPDRSGGIKVFTQGLTAPDEGATVTVVGSLMTDNGERAVRLSTLQTGSAAEIPAPVGMSNVTLCGGPIMGFSPVVNGGLGLNTIGLLVTAWGTVNSIGDNYYFIDDRTGVMDATGVSGIKISTSNLFPGITITPPTLGDYVRITGIASIEPTATGYRRVLRPRSQADITKLQ